VLSVDEVVGVMAEKIREVELLMARAEAYFLGAWGAAEAWKLDFELYMLSSDREVFTQMRDGLMALNVGA